MRMVTPKSLQRRAVVWYHHYLQHPGKTRLEATLSKTMTWDGMRPMVENHVKPCDSCQRNKRHNTKYGKLPTKHVISNHWEVLCVDLIGPYTLKSKDGTILDFMCLTMIDPASSWFEMVELPPVVDFFTQNKKTGKYKVTSESFDKTSSKISRLVNQSWL